MEWVGKLMSRFLLGVLIGMALVSPSLWALRLDRPPEFAEWNTNTFTQLNNVLLQIFNVLNGRFQTNVSTIDPDGVRRGAKGEFVLYDPGASEELCQNVDGLLDWDCVALTP